MTAEQQKKERPILFNSEMVRAILPGTKTQTRRPVKLNLSGRLQKGGKQWHVDDPNATKASPFGISSDRLWVRETFTIINGEVVYRADYQASLPFAGCRWSPSIHMPRWASRITLEVKRVWTEYLQDISEADARAEGVKIPHCVTTLADMHKASRASFRDTWDSIYAKRGFGWHTNPCVRVCEFKYREVASVI